MTADRIARSVDGVALLKGIRRVVEPLIAGVFRVYDLFLKLQRANSNPWHQDKKTGTCAFSRESAVGYHPDAIPRIRKILIGNFYFQYTPSSPLCNALGGCSVSSGSKPKTSMRNASLQCAK